MSPLVTLLLLGLLLVVVAVMLVWSLVSTIGERRQPGRGGRRGKRRERAGREAEPAAFEREAAPTTPPARRSNDDLRGARADQSPAHPNVPDDAFERFLRAGRDDDR